MEKENVLEIEIKKVFLGYAWLIKRNKLKVIRNLGTQSRPSRSEFYDKELFVELKQHDNYYEEIKYGTPERNYFFENNRLMSEEEKEKLIEIVNKINEKYGIHKRWRADDGERYYYIDSYQRILDNTDLRHSYDDMRYELGNYFKTKEQAQKVIDSKEWQEFWEKVRNGEIGGDE
jgi:putative uncharacterized protein FNV0866